ncbi:MAG: prefoldin subunit beta [archaeon]
MSQDEKIREMQILEHNIQNIAMQRQSFEAELSETQSALREIEKTKDDVFKIIGQVMLKTDKEKIKGELQEKTKILEMRADSMNKQEELLSKKLDKLREEVFKK